MTGTTIYRVSADTVPTNIVGALNRRDWAAEQARQANPGAHVVSMDFRRGHYVVELGNVAAKPRKRMRNANPPAPGTMRVSVYVQMDVDVAAYEAEYGERTSAADIRDHVKGVIGTAARSAFENIPAVQLVDWE
jgi:hypothetical protein